MRVFFAIYLNALKYTTW